MDATEAETRHMSGPRLTVHRTTRLRVPETRQAARLSVVQGGAPVPRVHVTYKNGPGDLVTVRSIGRGTERVVITVVTRRADVTDSLCDSVCRWVDDQA